jgi:MOSC domain-containing protein YiiM
MIAKGDMLVLKARDTAGVTVSFANQTLYHDNKNCAAIDKVLSVGALSESWQQSFFKLKEQCR